LRELEKAMLVFYTPAEVKTLTKTSPKYESNSNTNLGAGGV
jgi:hypothetical protein